MKLIIDIPERYYEFCRECLINRTDTVDQMYIANGTPYEERPQGEWVPVSERLPDKEGHCIVSTDYGDVTMDSFVDGIFVLNLGSVIAWQELPEPYKEADNDKK